METTMSFDLSTVPANIRSILELMPESDRENAWNMMLAATTQKLAGDKEHAKKLRDAAKADAEKNREEKLQAVKDMCEDLGIEPPTLVKSLHRTDKKVKVTVKGVEVVKIPQVLCGCKFNVEGMSGSLDLYISTGKGAKVTDATEVKVTEAHALALRLFHAIEEAGFSVGESTDTEDETED